MSNENLVYIGKITLIEEIKNADKIVRAEVICGRGGKWSGVVPKGSFEVGELCQVYLQDSILPQEKQFEFLKSSSYRIKIQRLRGVPSECLIWKKTIDGNIGDDITKEANVTRYSKPIPLCMKGEIKGEFPSFIPKTDETNFQAVPHLVQELTGHPYYVTVKADGSSATIYKKDGEISCCSRNREWFESDSNAIWKVAHKYNLRENLKEGFALQFELVGPGIQRNPLGLESVSPLLFDVYDFHKHCYLPYFDARVIATTLHFPIVETICVKDRFEYSTEELVQLSIGKYPNGKQREGIVCRSLYEKKVVNERVSFKVINPLYKG